MPPTYHPSLTTQAPVQTVPLPGNGSGHCPHTGSYGEHQQPYTDDAREERHYDEESADHVPGPQKLTQSQYGTHLAGDNAQSTQENLRYERLSAIADRRIAYYTFSTYHKHTDAN